MTTIADTFLEREVSFYDPPCPPWCAIPRRHVLARRDGKHVACHRSVEIDGVDLRRVDEMDPVHGLSVGPLWLTSDRRGCEDADPRTQAAVERSYAALVS